MKKLLAIVVLGLLWCNVGFAEFYELNKCYSVEYTKKGITKKNCDSWECYKNWSVSVDQSLIPKYYSPGHKIKVFEDYIYTIDSTNGTVTQTTVYTDEYHLYMNRLFADLGPREKVETTIFRIESYAGEFIKAKYDNTLRDEKGNVIIKYADQKLTIDLKNSIIHSITDIAGSADYDTFSKFQCNKKSSETEAETASGTAFFINSKGYLLTNNHVVDGCKQLKINYFDKEYDAKLIATDKTLDLALLKVDLRPKSYISFSDYNPKKLQKIYVAGYPFGKGLSDDLKISSGIVSSLKGIEDNSNELQIDAAINYGNSGGPIVGEGGELVAIAVSGLAKEMAEGINFGIKSSAAMNFLGANDIEPSRVKKSLMNNDRLLKLLEESTLFISCTY